MPRTRRRTILVLVSIAAHVAIGIAFVATGLWNLERLDSDHRIAAIGVMTPSQLIGGSPAALPEPTFERKKLPERERKIAKNVQWEKRVARPERVEVTTAQQGEHGNGQGEGEGDHEGDGRDDGSLCTDIAGCIGTGGEVPAPPKPPEPPAPKIQIVPPTVMNALRISGNTQIHPSWAVKNEILRAGKNRVVGNVKLCIATSGAITSATMLSTTGYPAYDAQLLAGVRSWRYRPYTVNGVPQPACSPVSFVYVIASPRVGGSR